MCRMHSYEEEGDEDGDEGEDSTDHKTNLVKRMIMPYRFFRDGHVLQRGVAFWPRHLER